MTDHPGLFPLSCFRHDVAEEPSVLFVNSEKQNPWHRVLLEHLIVPSVDEADFFGMHFKINVFEFFGVRLLQKRIDAFVDK